MNIFITATDTDVGKTYISKGIIKELVKRGIKTGYFKPLQSGVVKNVLSDIESVKLGLLDNVNRSFKPNLLSTKEPLSLVFKNSYITNTPCTPSISAKIDGIQINLDKIEQDYRTLEKECEIIVTEGSGGLFVPVTDNTLISDVIKRLDLPVLIVARPNLGTINHVLLTLNALYDLKIKVLGIVISNYPKDTEDPAIITAPKLIEKFAKKYGDIKILDIIKEDEDNFTKIADEILK